MPAAVDSRGCVFGDQGRDLGASFYPDGFAVLTPSADPFSGERYLLIWIAYANGGDGADGEAYVFALAKRAGFKKVRMYSPRRGFERCGWSIVNIEYEKGVT